MKRIILSMALVVGLSAFSSLEAQNRGKRSDNRRDMPKELKLTDDQRSKMSTIEADFKKKFEKINDSKLTAEERKDQLAKLREEKMEARKKVLTAEQQEFFNKRTARYADNKRPQARRDDNRRSAAKMRQDRRTPMANWGGCCMQQDGCPLAQKLDLTDAQKEEMKKLQEENKKDREQMRKKHREAMEKILTPEQLKKVKEKK